MREDIQRLTAEMRAAIAEKLCVDLDLDEEDLRALLRDEILKEIEDSVVNEADEILKERLTGEIKNEIYEEVYQEICDECFDDLRGHYLNDETFVSQVKSEVRAEAKQQVIDQLKQNFEMRS
jgi:ribosomal protein L19E